MKNLFLLILTVIPAIASGQQTLPETFSDTLILKNMVTIQGERDPELMKGFLFPEFTIGEILYKNGSKSSARLNYDAVYRRMLFLSDDGQYMILGELEKIAMVTIGTRKFIPLKGDSFMELLSVNGENIFKEHKYDFTTRGIKSAYGDKPQTYAIENLRNINVNTILPGTGPTIGSYQFPNNPNQITVDQSRYYIYNKNNKLVPVVSIRTLYRVFGHRSEIKSFIKNNDLDFDNSEDFILIMKYCHTLN